MLQKGLGIFKPTLILGIDGCCNFGEYYLET
jgi:hypothetical protein